MISVKINDDFRKKLGIFATGMGNIWEYLTKDVGQAMADDAKALAPVNTGQLKNSIKFRFDRNNNSGLLTTFNGKRGGWYATFVEANRHITAKKADYLTFRIGGKWVKVKSVDIAGRPFMSTVADDYFGSEGSKGYNMIEAALDRYIRENLQ